MRPLVVCLLVSACSAGTCLADVAVPAVFASNMVLQQGAPVTVWGTARAGEEVTVSFAGQTKSAVTGASGKWQVRLDAMKASAEPREMVVSAGNTLRFENVLVGEVWICAGQSNMEMPLSASFGGSQAAADATEPAIRLLHVAETACAQPACDIRGAWRMCSPKEAGEFSAVGYYFGRQLQKELNVPVGLIECAWSGTQITPWIPRAELQSCAWARNEAQKLKDRNKWLLGFAQEKCELKDTPSALCNGMVSPIAPFAIRGVIWYQGENNNDDGIGYYEKMKTLITGWRHEWGQGDFPFYYVQLAPFRYVSHEATNLPKVWEAQRSCLSLPNTGMAVTTDLVENVNEIHPRDKLDVAKRLSLWALAKTYGREIAYSGPVYKSMAVEGSKVRLGFEYSAAGLDTRDGKPLTCFEVAGPDGRYKPAAARIDGQSVVVWSDEVKVPVSVRMGRTDTDQPNLMNKEGLPASPFCTGLAKDVLALTKVKKN